MEIQEEYNYNDPLELREVFRVTMPGQPQEEYSSMVAVAWEDVRGVEQFFAPDTWQKYPGEKFFLILAGRAEPKLILGSYDNILKYWRQLRNMYPSFYDPEDYEDEDDNDND